MDDDPFGWDEEERGKDGSTDTAKVDVSHQQNTNGPEPEERLLKLKLLSKLVQITHFHN